MNRLRGVVLGTLCVVAGAFALEFEFGIDAGFGLPAGGDNIGMAGYDLVSYERTENASGAYTYEDFDDEYVSFGSGLKFHLDATAYLHDNIGVIFQTGISLIGGRTLDQVSHENDGSVEELELKLRGNYVPILLGLKFRTDADRIKPYLYLAAGLIIPAGVKAEGTYNETGDPVTDITMETDMTLGFGVSAGLGATYAINDMISLRAEFNPTYGFARANEVKTVTTQAGSSFTTNFVYEKNEGSLPADQIGLNGATIYEHGGPTFSFSSIGVRVGIVIGL